MLYSHSITREYISELNTDILKYCNDSDIIPASISIAGHYKDKAIGSYDYYIAFIYYNE